MNIDQQLLGIIREVTLRDDTIISDSVSQDDLLSLLKGLIGILMEMVSNNRNIEYEELERIVQKNEAEVRQHIRLEQQMKLYSDSQQEKVEQLESEKSRLLKHNMELQTDNATQMQIIRDLEKRLQYKGSNTRDISPNITKKTYILGTEVLHQSTKTSLFQQVRDSKANIDNRDRRPSNTIHQSQTYNVNINANSNASSKPIFIKNIHQQSQVNNRDQRLSQHSMSSQEKILDKSNPLLRPQQSVNNIKTFNIQKLIIKNVQEQQLSQLKSKTINSMNYNQLDDSRNNNRNYKQ